MLEEGGMVIPNTVSEKGSLNSANDCLIGSFSSRSVTESSRVRDLGPMLDCFLRSRPDRGLSEVDTDDPETREGVGVMTVRGTSSLGRREEDD